MSELFTDLASTTLASGIGIGATTLTVQAGKGALFPTPTGGDYFTVFLFKKTTGEHEFVTCTQRTADVFNVISATTYAYLAGDVVELRPTAAFFTALAAGASSTNIQSGELMYGVDSGGADTITVSMTPTAASISDGQEVRIEINTDNTGGACTITLDALGAESVKTEAGGNPIAGSIKAGYTHTFIYDGTNFVLQNAGLSLTSAGFNAEAEQIKNVAAGTAATDAATIGGIETHTNKTYTSPTINTPIVDEVHDANGNEVVIFGSTASAVNEVTITNKATGGNPTIEASGEADIDFDLVRNGTGDITVDTVPIYGMVFLADPELLVDGGTTINSWRTRDSSTLNTAKAKAAIICIYVSAGGTASDGVVLIRTRQTGSSLGVVDSQTIKGAARHRDGGGASSLSVTASCETVINLDADYDFDYYVQLVNLSSATYYVSLIGYYT